MRSLRVVVAAYVASTCCRCRSPKISIRSVTSVRTVNTKRSAKQFARGHRGGILTTRCPRLPGPRRRRCELPGAVADEEPELGDMLAEVHDEVTGLLGGPGPVRMFGDAQNVQVAVADLEGNQHVDPPQRERAVDVEEVDREHAGGLGAQELPPAGIGMTQRRWWDPAALEDPPDHRRADAVAELEQLALQPHIAPAWFSRAIRTTKATRTSSTGGRPVRLG